MLSAPDARKIVIQNMETDWRNRLILPVQFWSELQSGFRCCGLHSAIDWGQRIPNSCCKHVGSTIIICDANNSFKLGCLQAVISAPNAATIIGVVVGFIGIFRFVWYATTYLIAHNRCCCPIERVT